MTEVTPDANANGDRPGGLTGSQQSLDEAEFITDRDLNWLCGCVAADTDNLADTSTNTATAISTGIYTDTSKNLLRHFHSHFQVPDISTQTLVCPWIFYTKNPFMLSAAKIPAVS